MLGSLWFRVQALRQIETCMKLASFCRRAYWYARNIGLYYPHRRYTNHYLFALKLCFGLVLAYSLIVWFIACLQFDRYAYNLKYREKKTLTKTRVFIIGFNVVMQKKRISDRILLILYIGQHFPLYLSFYWPLAYGQFEIALNSEVTPADNSFFHVDMMSFLQLIACSFYSPKNRDGNFNFNLINLNLNRI